MTGIGGHASQIGRGRRYCRPEGLAALEVAPQLASWERAGHPSQVRLATYLDVLEQMAASGAVDAVAPLAVELVVGLPESVPLTTGGRDLDNYLLPIATRLGAGRLVAAFGRKTHGQSCFAVEAARVRVPDSLPMFATQLTGSYVRAEWKTTLSERLRMAGVLQAPPGQVGLEIGIVAGTGRNWTALWKPLLDLFGPLLGESPDRPFHPTTTASPTSPCITASTSTSSTT